MFVLKLSGVQTFLLFFYASKWKTNAMQVPRKNINNIGTQSKVRNHLLPKTESFQLPVFYTFLNIVLFFWP